ncbi:amidohydrolase [Microbacterium testaceum]|uniref:Amidohydrolase n=1 Tax=Microbacterium testaceum TaxID=2033 RepID=A0A2T7WJA0_MICTE|nr:amidohydrolase [Microbacterium testaceum]PVE73079.1 amidohydrolase [Microbacterium testaceum]
MAIVFTGGTIRIDGRTSDVDRLVVVDGLVAEPGHPVPEDAEHIDLEGGLLLPAFGDGHVHPLLAGRERTGPALRDATSVAEIVGRVRAWAAASDAPWLVGGSYDATIVDGGLFDARWLDAAVPDRPVVLHAWDYHTAWVNTAALRAGGVDAETPDPALGRIVRRDDGSPSGTLVERPAIELVLAHAPRPARADDVDALAAATTHLAAQGIAWAQEAWAEIDDVPTWIAAARAGRLAVDVDLALRADPTRWPAQLDDLRATADEVSGEPGLTCRTVKFFVDGILENRTAHLLECYHDARTRGLPNWRPDQLAAAVAACDAAGFDVHLHAIGDAAVRAAIDAAETIRESLRRGRRVTIAHAQVVDPADLPRLADLDITFCFQPQWAVADAVMTELTLPRLGPARERQYRMRAARDAGARLSFGSDWPVTSPDVLLGLRTAVTRQDADGQPAGGWQPDERLTLSEAIDAATSGVALQAGDQDRRGTLRPGMAADLVWLDRDIRRAPADRITDARILGTWRRGIPTFAARVSALAAVRPEQESA